MKQNKKLHPFMDHLKKAKKQNAEFCNYPDIHGEIVCYDWMAEYVQSYMDGVNVTIKEITLDEIEELLFKS